MAHTPLISGTLAHMRRGQVHFPITLGRMSLTANTKFVICDDFAGHIRRGTKSSHTDNRRGKRGARV